MDTIAIKADLNEAQRQAVEAVRGPVIILAGAGSGKTTTITRRIANQVATGSFSPSQLLAVTFTKKAADELGRRLELLDVRGVEARTFHSAALSQLYKYQRGPTGRVLSSKSRILWRLRQSLLPPHRFAAPGDLATEIEWAKNRRITPASYLTSLNSHRPPIPAELMASLFSAYEAHKRRDNLIDFEDQLELAIRLFDENPSIMDQFRSRYLAFTVDEFQDVNPLQQNLLDRWLGDRDEVCVVGDDHQAIYSFIGSSPDYLLAMPKRFPHAQVFRLEENYRSTPQVLALANRMGPQLGGVRKELRTTRSPGPDPEFHTYQTSRAEVEATIQAIRSLLKQGLPHEEIAILYRVNFRSEEFEEALSRASMPYQVRGGAFLSRPGPRSVIRQLRGHSTDVAKTVRNAAAAEGIQSSVPEDIGEEEATRQADLARMVRLAEDFDDGLRTIADFLEDLQARFSEEGEGRGVNLLTYHRAKGLEFEAVVLPRLQEGELPYRRAVTREAVAEERRLLYVGITRARRFLFLSRTREKDAPPSRFLRDLELIRSATSGQRPIRVSQTGTGLERLRAWRAQAAKRDGPKVHRVFADHVLIEIWRKRPRDWADLAGIDGVKMREIEAYADDIIAIVSSLGASSARNEGERRSGGASSLRRRKVTLPNRSSVSGNRSPHPNAYAKWTAEEEKLLRSLYLGGTRIGELARRFGRQQGGIRARLKRLGLMD